MHHIELSYALLTAQTSDALIRNPLLDMLHAVQSSGSISKASKLLGLSYRHVWGSLRDWEQKLGRELIVWDKGQRAQLTDFGEKLLWAERQAQARLAPQIEALRGDIARAFSAAFDDSAHVLTLFASHDAALSRLRDFSRAQKLHLDIRFMGSVDAIAALNAGRCMLAGFHMLDQPGRATIAAATYRSLLKPGLHKLIGFAHRTQGLIVARGNPLGLGSVRDLMRPGLRYVNRAAGTGTRVLFDELLGDANIKPAAIAGYDTQEPSHAAVAQTIESSAADAGLGIEAAAHEKGLGFVPLVRERYHLVCLKSELTTPRVQALLAVLSNAEWQRIAASLPGYSVSDAHSGSVLALRSMLPWWHYPKDHPKAKKAALL